MISIKVLGVVSIQDTLAILLLNSSGDVKSKEPHEPQVK